MLTTELSTFITYNPWSVSPAMPLGELLSMLGSVDFHHWPVVDDDRRLVGVFSNSDLMRALYAQVEATSPAVSDDDCLKAIRDRRLSEIMSHRIVTTTEDECPASALQRLLDNHIHSLPVQESGRLLGVVTTSDFLREFSYGAWGVCRETATSAMQRCENAVDCDCTVDEAAEAMHLDQANFVSVLRGDFPLGIVTLRDIRMAKLRQTIRDVFGEEYQLKGASTVLELAATAPTIRPGERLSNVANLMVIHRRQAIAVVNQAGRLLGAVSEDVLLQAMLEALR
jgi:CBS-domain-containing membrane protein